MKRRFNRDGPEAATALAAAKEALTAMLDTYGPPGTLRDTLEYPPDHAISKARETLSLIKGKSNG
jgi:hypothetical protein